MYTKTYPPQNSAEGLPENYGGTAMRKKRLPPQEEAEGEALLHNRREDASPPHTGAATLPQDMEEDAPPEAPPFPHRSEEKNAAEETVTTDAPLMEEPGGKREGGLFSRFASPDLLLLGIAALLAESEGQENEMLMLLLLLLLGS